MIRHLSLSLLFITCLITSTVYGQQLQIKLAPKGSKLIENNYMWSLNATCTIHCLKAHNKIMVRVTKKKGSVNGKILSKGQVTSMVVDNLDSILVSADPGAQVSIFNLGNAEVQANCSA